jgi:hypothetical protein
MESDAAVHPGRPTRTGAADVAVTAAASSQGDFPIQFGILRGNRYMPLPGAPNPNRLSVWPAW